MYAAKLALFSLLLHLPLLLVSSDTRARIQKFNSHSHSHSHMHNMGDPSVVVFFMPEDLKPGNTIPIYFPTRELSQSLTHLISKQQADSIPFSLQQLPHLLRLFSFSPDSPQAKAMAETLAECERDPIEGEIKTCSTSWESMTQFLRTIFGSNTPVKSLSTIHLKRTHDGDIGRVDEYGILGIEQIPSPKMVACHTMPYAHTVLYCHHQADSETRVYRVALKGEENGDEVDAIAVCHMDTSRWERSHVSFQMLGIEPGSSPVCHFFPADHMVWVPA